MRKPRYYTWAGLEIPHEKLDAHYVVFGTTGSGKTLSIRMLMESVLRSKHVTPRFRAIVYDYKRELYPYLIGMGIPDDQCLLLQPFDTRSVAWDIAADASEPASAYELATILAPVHEKGDHPYFSSAAQDILRGVIGTLNEIALRQWTLNDILEITATPKSIEAFITKSEEGRRLSEVYFDTKAPTTASNIVSTIRTKLAPFETIARAWTHARFRISLKDWMQSRTVLVFGADKTVKTALDAINRAMFKRASQLITSRTDENPPDETWIFLDEARQLGRLDGLSDLLNEGRSKGAHVVLGFQDLEGLYAVYGEHIAREMVGNCGSIAVLKLNNPTTEKWASQYFGEFREMKRSQTFSSGSGGGHFHSSSSETFQEQKTEVLLPQEFHNFPPTNRTNGLTGVFQLSATDAWAHTIQADFIDEHLHAPGIVPSFAPRPLPHQLRVSSRFVDGTEAIGGALPGEPPQEPPPLEPWLPELEPAVEE